jgi:hypothetical protein
VSQELQELKAYLEEREARMEARIDQRFARLEARIEIRKKSGLIIPPS